MIHPSSLVRLAFYAGVALVVRAVVNEAQQVREEPARLPPPDKPRTQGRAKAPGRARQHS